MTLTEPQFRTTSSAMTHATHVRMAALTRTPLASKPASTEFLTAWAILGGVDVHTRLANAQSGTMAPSMLPH